MKNAYRHHIEVLKVLQKEHNWSRQKIKSVRGQVLSMRNFEDREEYIKKLIKREWRLD